MVYQNQKELDELVRLYRMLHPRRVLEIGSMFGGTLWHWMANALPGAVVVAVDLPVGPEDGRYHDVRTARLEWQDWAYERNLWLVDLQQDSRDQQTLKVAAIYAPYDFIFIDGGHDYRTIRADFINYWPMLRAGGLMAWHDVAYPDENPEAGDVGRFWRELKAGGQYKMREILTEPDQDYWGIGVIEK